MITVTLQRAKCIGCNYCYEISPSLFRMSKKDGKSVLLQSQDKKGFHSLRVGDAYEDEIQRCKEACPVSIIKYH